MEWTNSFINSLPDEAFAYIEPGGEKDEEGKTTPRSLRHFPHHTAEVKDPEEHQTVDLPHLKNALARAAQSPLGEKALPHLKRHAEALLKAVESRNLKPASSGRFREDSTLGAIPNGSPENGLIRGAVLLQAGFNQARSRYYPEETLRQAAPLLAGVKQYADHGEGLRSVREWWSTITEAWYDEGMKALRGNIAPHSSALREILANPVARRSIGLSIDASGQLRTEILEGVETQLVEGIEKFHSVDWVTEAGAGGRILESREERGSQEAKKPRSQEGEGCYAVPCRMSLEQQVLSRLRESPLPEPAAERVLEQMRQKEFESRSKLMEALEEAIFAEGQYLERVMQAGKVRELGDGGFQASEHPSERVRRRLLERADAAAENLGNRH